MESPEPVKPFLPIIMIAILGGLAKQAQFVLQGRKLTWKHFMMRAIISAFIGFVCYYILPATPWSYGLCGLLSWMGSDGISFLLDLVVKSRREKP